MEVLLIKYKYMKKDYKAKLVIYNLNSFSKDELKQLLEWIKEIPKSIKNKDNKFSSTAEWKLMK